MRIAGKVIDHFVPGIGQAIGPYVAGAIADAADSLFPAMLLASGVALLGAIGSALLRPASLRRASDGA